MSISERERRDIYTSFEDKHGERVANNIMQLLPNQPADQLVTRTDMHAFGAGLRGEMAELRGELKGEMAELRVELKGEMAELRAELKGEMAELRADMVKLDARIIELGAELRSEIASLRVDTQRLMIGAIAANTVAVVAALLT